MNGTVAVMHDLPMGQERQLGDLQYGVRQTCGLSARRRGSWQLSLWETPLGCGVQEEVYRRYLHLSE